MKNTDWALCGYLYCDFKVTRRLYEREELCKKNSISKCINLSPEQINRLKCCDMELVDVAESGVCENKDNATRGKLCDNVCDNWNCVDESECNGFFYGMTCQSNIAGHIMYIPPYEVCNNKIDCISWVTWGSDEKDCDLERHIESPSCTSGEILRVKNAEQVVKIFNFTRCSAIEINSSGANAARLGVHDATDNAIKFGAPYCNNYIDQTNCSDLTRTAVSCHIKGYGYSTIAKTMVCGSFRRGFCDNGMDIACVSVDRNCTVHKHQLCDEIEDCTSGADEKHPACYDLTEHTCLRNFRTGRSLKIPVAWLGDGLEDCENGADENWKIVCGHSPMTQRYEVSNECQDVFICRFGFKKFIRLRELCNGIDKCGNENLICEVGQSLSSISTPISTKYGYAKTMAYCQKGLNDLVAKQRNLCVSQEFNPFNEILYGVKGRVRVTYLKEKTDCRFVFGEAYVLLSCMGECKNSSCPLKNSVQFNDCPAQFRGRIYTVVNKNRLTFVTRRANDYHNDYFVCTNGFCVDYDKVCNVWDDCGDGSDEVNCTNSFHCKDKQGIIPLSKKCDSNPDCGDMSDECNSDCSKEIINQPFLKGAAWFIGFIAVVSNTVVFFENGGAVLKCKSADSLTNKLLVNLIALGDLLVGVYLFLIATADSAIFGKEYCAKQFEWLTSWYCSCLGVISTFGSLVSLFSLTALSFHRALRVYEGLIPHDEGINNREKFSITALVSFIVVSAAAIASVTLFPVLEDYFVNGLVYDNSIRIFPRNMIGKGKHLEIIQSYYGRSKTKTLRWRLINSLIRSMFSKDYGNLDGKIAQVDFYGNDGVCLFKFFVRRDDPQWVFTMINLAISIACFTVVAAAYIYINISTYKSSRTLTKEAGPTAKTINKRNKKLQRKVATIIITDFLCWVPFVLICMLHFFEVMNASSHYGLFSIIILPINSLINPFLYSEIMWEFVRKMCTAFSSLLRCVIGGDKNVNQVHREEIELRSVIRVS